MSTGELGTYADKFNEINPFCNYIASIMNCRHHAADEINVELVSHFAEKFLMLL
jgi:hypothetical protein